MVYGKTKVSIPSLKEEERFCLKAYRTCPFFSEKGLDRKVLSED